MTTYDARERQQYHEEREREARTSVSWGGWGLLAALVLGGVAMILQGPSWLLLAAGLVAVVSLGMLAAAPLQAYHDHAAGHDGEHDLRPYTWNGRDAEKPRD